MIAECDNRQTVTRELGAWREGDGRGQHGRAFLQIEVMEHQHVAPHLTVDHQPVQYPALEVSAGIAFRSAHDLEGWVQGPHALEYVEAVMAPGLQWRGQPILQALGPLVLVLDRWQSSGLNAYCSHAPVPSQRHTCPGRGYGCTCCPLDGPTVVVDMAGGVGIVRGGASRYEAGQRCEHDCIGRDYGCGYRSGSAWLYDPLPAGLWGWVQGQIGGHDLLDAVARVEAVAREREAARA